MKPIVHQEVTSSNCPDQHQNAVSTASSLASRAIRHPAFIVPSVLPFWFEQGFILLGGLTYWFDLLNPFTRQEAWNTLKDPKVSQALRANPHQQQRFFLNDLDQVDDQPQLSANFEVKTRKSHLTVVEGADEIGRSQSLPQSVRQYLQDTRDFIASVRELVDSSLPNCILPTILKVRVFEYLAETNSSSGPAVPANESMRPHVDGSLATLIIAKSDGLLRFGYKSQWFAAARENGKPFSMLIPGVAAKYAYGVLPTPHMVLASAPPRASLTIFFTPALSDNRQTAESQMSLWRTALSSNRDEMSFAE